MTIEQLKLNGWKDELGNLWNDPNSDEWIIYNTNEIFTPPRFYHLPKWWTGFDEDTYVTKHPREFMNSIGRSMEDYIIRFKFNLSETEICDCPGCNNHKRIIGKGFNDSYISNTCSFSCSRSIAMRWQIKDYYKRGVYTEESRRRMAESISNRWKDPDSTYNTKDYRDKLSSSISKGVTEYYKSHPEAGDEISLKIREAWKDPNSGYHSELEDAARRQNGHNALTKFWDKDTGLFRQEYYVKLRSELAIKNNLDPNNNFGKGNNHKYCAGYFIKKSGESIYYRSSYEYKFMELLDNSIFEWSYETLSIKYIIDNESHYYVIDFHVKSLTREYAIEIKPKSMMDDPLVITKATYAIQWCLQHDMTYIMLGEDIFKYNDIYTLFNDYNLI